MTDAVVDRAKLAELRAVEQAGKDGFLSRIVNLFLADARSRMADIRRAVPAQDSQAVAMAAHTLKGSCYYVGANRLATLCRQLEDMAGRGAVEVEALAALEQELELVSEQLAEEIRRSG